MYVFIYKYIYITIQTESFLFPDFPNLKSIFEYGNENEKNSKSENKSENENCWLPLNIINKDNHNNERNVKISLDSTAKNKKKNHKKVNKKVFLFIIDAIRLDFMTWKKENNDDYIYDENYKENKLNERNSDKNEKQFEKNENGSGSGNETLPSFTSALSSSYNKFINMHKYLKNNASQTAFFGFRADPPTVTSQRLKGYIYEYMYIYTYIYLSLCIFTYVCINYIYLYTYPLTLTPLTFPTYF
jgi:hypothetical protein